MRAWLKERWRYWFGVRYFYEPERFWNRFWNRRISRAYYKRQLSDLDAPIVDNTPDLLGRSSTWQERARATVSVEEFERARSDYLPLHCSQCEAVARLPWIMFEGYDLNAAEGWWFSSEHAWSCPRHEEH